MQRSALCRYRRELSNEYFNNLLATIGVDTAENEPLEVWRKIQFIIHLPPYSRAQIQASRGQALMHGADALRAKRLGLPLLGLAPALQHMGNSLL